MQGTSHPSCTSLRRIRSLSQFSDQNLKSLAASLQIETTGPGECLIDLGSCEKFSLYLVEGGLRAVSHDHQETRLAYADEGELFPIAQIRPSMYRVVADGPVRFFRLYSDQLANFARHKIEDEPEAGFELVEIDEAAEQPMFQIQLFKDLLAGKLKLPSLPDVALRIQQAYADNLVTAGTVGAVLQSDPVIRVSSKTWGSG
jgi:hypothetical protein